MIQVAEEARGLAGKVAIVTGGSSGIGFATVCRLIALGADVAIFDIASVQVGTFGLLESEGHRLKFCQVDVSVSAQVRSAVHEVVAEFGGIDILVNCAGIGGGGIGRIVETSDEAWDRIQAVDLRSVFICIREVARQMIEQGRGGRIVSVSSSSAFRAVEANAAYAAAKAGIGGLTRVAAGELGGYGINVNAVAPGLTATPMNLKKNSVEAMQAAMEKGPRANLLKRLSEPSDAAETLVFLTLPASRQITGQVIHTSAGSIV